MKISFESHRAASGESPNTALSTRPNLSHTLIGPEDPVQVELTERVADTIRPFLKNASDLDRVVPQVVSITEETYSGPTPHPEHLERLEAISPGAAGDIIGMAIREQKSRNRLELLVVLYPYLGMVAGLIATCGCLLITYLLAMSGHSDVAYATIGVPVVGVIGWFINARQSREDQ